MLPRMCSWGCPRLRPREHRSVAEVTVSLPLSAPPAPGPCPQPADND